MSHLDYLKNYPKTNEPGMKPVRVIHEGLKNRPDLYNLGNYIIQQMLLCLNGEKSHLSDIAGVLAMRAKEMQELSKEIFEAHEIEKDQD